MVEEHLNLNQKDVSVNLEEVKVVRWIHDYQEAVIDLITSEEIDVNLRTIYTRKLKESWYFSVVILPLFISL